MRKKFLVLAAVVTVLAAMTACGGSDSANNATNDTKKESVSDTKKDNTNVEDPTTNESEKNKVEVNKPSNPETNNSESTEKQEIISAAKEEEIVVDFDGVKLPLCITWEDFQKFMTEHNWTLVDDKSSFPRYERKEFSGGGLILTNCGEVEFYFTENETNTEAVLSKVFVYSDNSGTKVSINGITCKTTEKELSKSLTAKEGSDAVYYMDDFVEIGLCETEINDTDGMVNFYIERTPFHMR